jgi:nitroimidazol reductase NimA-like FMN-containing flavoprotein (pyridoxamine 5'-phosphate oxidase superfamily)
MRRSDKEVKDLNEIVDILRRCNTIRLGLHDAPYPYVVPLSFGMEVLDGRISIYFHGATEGLKHDLIRANPHVCVEASLFYGYKETKTSVATEYESVIGFGKAVLVSGEEAIKGLDLLLEHCEFGGYQYDHKVLDVTAVYKVTFDTFTGKSLYV